MESKSPHEPTCRCCAPKSGPEVGRMFLLFGTCLAATCPANMMQYSSTNKRSLLSASNIEVYSDSCPSFGCHKLTTIRAPSHPLIDCQQAKLLCMCPSIPDSGRCVHHNSILATSLDYRSTSKAHAPLSNAVRSRKVKLCCTSLLPVHKRGPCPSLPCRGGMTS